MKQISIGCYFIAVGLLTWAHVLDVNHASFGYIGSAVPAGFALGFAIFAGILWEKAP